MPEPVTTGTAWYPTMLPDGRHFLFLAGEAGLSEEAIYLGSRDSKETRKLKAATSKAELSPSGHLVFQRGTVLMAQPFDISTLHITGAAVPIAADVGLLAVSRTSEFSVAANGLIVYQTGGVGRSALTWFDRFGKAHGVLDDANFYEDGQISPDGKSVAVTRLDPKTLKVGLWVTDLARGITTRMTSEDEIVEQPSRSPDGKRIAYDARKSESQIYIREFTGTGTRESIADGVMTAWSPEGSALLFSRRSTSGASVGLFIVPLGGSQTFRVHPGKHLSIGLLAGRKVGLLLLRRIGPVSGLRAIVSRRTREMADLEGRWRAIGVEARWPGIILRAEYQANRKSLLCL